MRCSTSRARPSRSCTRASRTCSTSHCACRCSRTICWLFCSTVCACSVNRSCRIILLTSIRPSNWKDPERRSRFTEPLAEPRGLASGLRQLRLQFLDLARHAEDHLHAGDIDAQLVYEPANLLEPRDVLLRIQPRVASSALGSHEALALVGTQRLLVHA